MLVWWEHEKRTEEPSEAGRQPCSTCCMIACTVLSSPEGVGISSHCWLAAPCCLLPVSWLTDHIYFLENLKQISRSAGWLIRQMEISEGLQLKLEGPAQLYLYLQPGAHSILNLPGLSSHWTALSLDLMETFKLTNSLENSFKYFFGSDRKKVISIEVILLKVMEECVEMGDWRKSSACCQIQPTISRHSTAATAWLRSMFSIACCTQQPLLCSFLGFAWQELVLWNH